MGRKKKTADPPLSPLETCTPEQVADYIASHADGLATLATSVGLDALAYLLRMAELEARNVLTPPQEQRQAA